MKNNISPKFMPDLIYIPIFSYLIYWDRLKLFLDIIFNFENKIKNVKSPNHLFSQLKLINIYNNE